MALTYNFKDNNFITYTPAQQETITYNNPLSGFEKELDWASDLVENSEYDTPIPLVKRNVEVSPSNDFIDQNNPEEEVYVPDTDVEFETVPISSNNADYSDILNLSFEELIKKENLPIRITSGYRKGATTTSGKRSNHSFKDERGFPTAYDITPAKGHSWQELEHLIYEDPKIVSWFKAHNWGVLEEMYRDNRRGFYDVRGKWHYTKASGTHFHIGPDKYAREWYNSRALQTAPSTSSSKLPKNKWLEELTQAYRDLGISENGIKNLIAKNALESGWGESTVGDFNYGNIKTGKVWSGESKKGYRSYNSIQEYARDEVQFLKKLYDFDDKDDIKTFVNKLQGGNKDGRRYAESPTYKQKVIQIREQLG